ncbi:MAG: Gfo/Idh/MocA family protein [Gemmatimonadales bacterium]
MSDKLRVAVIGAGAIAQVAHLSVLSRLDDVETVALCDADLVKARSIAARLEIPEVFDDAEDLLSTAKPDAVVICTPNHLHEVHAVSALAAGAHVLCERPLAITEEGLRRVRDEQRRRGRVVMVGMNHRFRSDVQAARQFLAGGELGSLRSIRAGWYTFQTEAQQRSWRARLAQSGGGAMLDLGLPIVDLALWLAGYPEVVRVSAVFARGDGEVEDSGCALLRCAGGVSIFVDVSWQYIDREEKFWFRLVGDAGSAKLAPLRVYKKMHGAPVDVTPSGAVGRQDQFTFSYRAEWAHFLGIVRGSVEGRTLDDQLRLHRTMDALQRSAAQGRDVEL